MCRRYRCLGSLSLFALLVSGCGDDDGPPANVAGDYTLAITNGPSTCDLPNWVQGEMATGIPLRIDQTGASVTAEVSGAGAVGLQLITGSAVLEGTVTGSRLDLRIPGTRQFGAGSCAYTVDATVVAEVNDDVIEGTIEYAPNTNTSADCAGVAACSASQQFNGTRPPGSGG